MRIHVKQLPCPEAEFRAKLAHYIAERKAHSLTVGVPAPLPEFDIFRAIADRGGEIEVYDDPPDVEDESVPPVPPDTLEVKRAAALRAIEERRLAQAIADPDAPQEVKEYAAALAAKSEAQR